MSASSAIRGDQFRPLKNTVFVSELDRGPRQTPAGVLIPDDDMTERGVRDRWAKVYAVGPEVSDLQPGQWVLVKHGRWTHGITLDLAGAAPVRVWRVDYPEHVLLATDTDPRTSRPVQLHLVV